MALTVFRYMLVVFFVVAGINHFRDPEFYLPMMPPYIPAHRFMIAFSGISEIVAAILLAVPRTSRAGAWFIIAHLVIFFTVHIYMLQETNGEFEGIPTMGLVIRIVMQFIFMGWAWLYTRSPEAIAAASAPKTEIPEPDTTPDAD